MFDFDREPSQRDLRIAETEMADLELDDSDEWVDSILKGLSDADLG
jgi:hypothetical protein